MIVWVAYLETGEYSSYSMEIIGVYNTVDAAMLPGLERLKVDRNETAKRLAVAEQYLTSGELPENHPWRNHVPEERRRMFEQDIPRFARFIAQLDQAIEKGFMPKEDVFVLNNPAAYTSWEYTVERYEVQG